MYIMHFDECEEFISADEAVLREFLHPDKSPLQLRYSLAHASVEPGMATAPHRLKEASEVYFIMRGEGLAYVDEETAPVRSGHAVYIPPGSRQYIENTGDGPLEFLCIVEPAWRVEDEEVF